MGKKDTGILIKETIAIFNEKVLTYINNLKDRMDYGLVEYDPTFFESTATSAIKNIQSLLKNQIRPIRSQVKGTEDFERLIMTRVYDNLSVLITYLQDMCASNLEESYIEVKHWLRKSFDTCEIISVDLIRFEQYRDSEETIKFGSNQFEITEFIRRNHSDFDCTSLFDKYRVIFFTEQHSLISPKDDFIAQIPKLAKRGVTHLGYEFLPTSMQSNLDKFYESGYGEPLLAYFIKYKFYGRAKEYMKIIETARKHRIQIIALDFDADVMQRNDISATFESRNVLWANLIAKLLKSNSHSKIVIYCGGAHAGYYPAGKRANNRLRELGYDSLVVEYCGGVIFSGDDYMFDAKIAKSAIELGLQKTRFAVRLDRSTSRGADLFIHLPQNENRSINV